MSTAPTAQADLLKSLVLLVSPIAGSRPEHFSEGEPIPSVEEMLVLIDEVGTSASLFLQSVKELLSQIARARFCGSDQIALDLLMQSVNESQQSRSLRNTFDELKRYELLLGILQQSMPDAN